MLDALILRYLTKKGKIAYFVGQVLLIAIYAFYIFGISGGSLDTDENIFFIGMITIVLLWAGVCLLIWKKPKEEKRTDSVIK